jgi:hypothetical protein
MARGQVCVLVVIAALAPCGAGAQTTTADGIQALIRSDYATATRILRPLAEEAPQPDPLALFFMATLYHSGHGAALNQIRACGLYLRAAATPASPLQVQSLALARVIHMDVPVIRDECTAASAGAWGDPPAALFTLGQNHWVRIDQEGFVVGYKGTQKTVPMTMGGPGWMFLPIRHTQLDVSRPVAVRRHFIEFFMWVPYVDQAGWTLWWSAYEVVGADAVWARGDGILTAAHTPPSVAVGDVARIRVNADGEAEWVVLGANPRSGLIPYTGSR